MSNFDFVKNDQTWQQRWAEDGLYKVSAFPAVGKNKIYVLDMFPYPSGAGLHVGHIEGYSATDVYARFQRMRGREVLHPMGFDAFGLPAENFAIKNNIHPKISTDTNIANFRDQIKRTGLSYDWSREFSTADPEYYKWTQWLFILMFKMGLAYKGMAQVNWCPSCETVLANEQVIDGHCERCDTQVVQKELSQWFFRITKYADRLLDGLDGVDWPASVKASQKNWIGRKAGRNIKFGEIEVFTTRPDTINSATFIALSPNHPLVPKYFAGRMAELEAFLTEVAAQPQDSKIKLGLNTGRTAVNPVNGQNLPVYISNYVSSDFGVGAIMGVPGYDERDLEFATTCNLPVVSQPTDPNIAIGSEAINYRLRDWLISRQRYWGAPIPMVECPKCGWQPVPEDQLPVLLPTDVEFKPTGVSPLVNSQSFQQGVTCPNCGGPAKREVDTIDVFGDSAWYFLRFCDPQNSQKIFDASKVKAWMPVDLYVGGDHATTHLIYSRFMTKVLQDAGLIDFSEPFQKFYMIGHILGEDNRKMSKRWGNVVNPIDVIDKFGADTLRMYVLFMGPLNMAKAWNTAGVEGIYRFLNRCYRLFQSTQAHTTGDKLPEDLQSGLYKLIGKVTSDIENLNFNTAISAMMETINLAYTYQSQPGDWASFWKIFTLILAPFAPHLAEQLWSELNLKFSVHQQAWPEFDPTQVKVSKVVLIVQVNGKLKDRIELEVEASLDEQKVKQAALASDKVKEIVKNPDNKAIFVPGKIINFVV